MTGPVSYPILYTDAMDVTHNTYGAITLNAGTATLNSLAIKSNSKILLTRLTVGTNPAGSISFTNLVNGSFTIQSSAGTDNGIIIYLILRPTSDLWTFALPIGLPLCLQNETIGLAQFSAGTATVVNAMCKSNSLIFISRYTGFPLQNAETSFSAINNGSFTINSTSVDDEGFFRYLILTPSYDYSNGSPGQPIIPPLDSSGAPTFGEATLSGGTVTVNTAVCDALLSNVFITKSSGTNTATTYYVTVNDGSFNISSTSGTDASNIFWWLINLSIL